jgi:S1-C subfamily serine protease
MDVTEGSGADKAGIQPTRRASSGDIIPGDLIVAINDDPVKSNNDLLLTLKI